MTLVCKECRQHWVVCDCPKSVQQAVGLTNQSDNDAPVRQSLADIIDASPIRAMAVWGDVIL